MEVAVPEEPQKKIFRARKTMKSSDRQQLEALHSTLGTSSSAHPPSSSQADKPLVNGTHSENDKETTTSTTHSNYGLENKSEDLLTKNLEESDGKDCEKSVEVEIDKKDTCEAEASDCPAKGAPRDGSGEKTFAVDMEDALLASTFLRDSSEEKKEKSNKSSTSSLSASPSGLDCDPEVKEGFLCLSEEDDSQADGSDDQKVEGEEVMHMDIEVGDQQDTSENKKVSAVALGTKRSLSEEENEPQELQERDEKRARMDGEELEAQLELKITATAGSRHKLEKVVQQLVEERLRVLELTVFDGNLKELKERVDKIETTNKQQNLQQQMNTLQAKIARLSKKFGAANQASENSKRANETRAPQSNTTPQQRTVKTTADPKPSPVSTNTTTVPAQPKILSTPNMPNSSTLASQAPILQIISTTTSSTPSSTSLPGPSQTGTLLLKAGPNTGVMTSTPVSSGGQPMSIQPLLIQLPLAMTNGQSGALVNAAGGVGLIPVSSLSSVSGINKVKTTTPATTFIIQKSAGSGALSSVTSSTPAMSLARVVNPGGTGTVSSPSTGISVTTARTPAQCAAVVGASTGVTATGTTGPAATGSAAAAPGPPLSSALTTKTGTSVLLLKLVSDNMGRTRESYTVDFKLGVVLFAEEHGNHMAARKFGVNRSCVIRWIKNKQTLLTANRNAQSFRGPRTGRYPDIEDGLLEYFRTLQDDECTITREMLQLKAGELARKNNIPTSEFKASTGWVVRFMRRKGLAIRKRKSQCQELAKDYADKLLEFRKFMTCQRESQQYLPSQIGYADQTSVFFDTSRNAKNETEGVPTVSVKTTGFEKICCTVMLAVTADGGKLPPYVIFKRKKTPKGNFPNGIHVRIQEKGWMRGDLVEDWINAVWERRPGALLQQRSLLVLDSFRGHLGDDIKSRLEARETDLAIIPRGLTKMLQPLDASINKPFDYYLHWLFNNWMAGDNHEMTKCGHIKRPNLETICRWILDAWALITPEVIVSSLKKTGISNELDGTEDHLLWEEIGEIEDFSSVDDVSIASDSSEDKD